jgi:hypothetical protein
VQSVRSYGARGQDVPSDQMQTEAHGVDEFAPVRSAQPFVEVLLPSYTAVPVDRREVLSDWPPSA